MITARAHLAAMTLTATLLALAAACGGGSTGSTSAPSSATSQLPATSSAVPSRTPSSTVPATSTVSAYFLRNEKVAPAQRTASGTAVAAAAVQALLDGPTATEKSAGLSSAVPAGVSLRSLNVSNETATVDLSSAFASGGGSFSMQARWAQLVTTLTQFPSVQRVQLQLDGKPATTLGGEGLIIDHPFTRSDLEEWLPAILVDQPAEGATVTSPVRVRGSANVFEAVLFVEVTDWDGRIVANQRVRASSGTGTRGTFDTSVSYQADRSGSGELIVYSLSPKDGSRINVQEIRLTVTP